MSSELNGIIDIQKEIEVIRHVMGREENILYRQVLKKNTHRKVYQTLGLETPTVKVSEEPKLHREADKVLLDKKLKKAFFIRECLEKVVKKQLDANNVNYFINTICFHINPYTELRHLNFVPREWKLRIHQGNLKSSFYNCEKRASSTNISEKKDNKRPRFEVQYHN